MKKFIIVLILFCTSCLPLPKRSHDARVEDRKAAKIAILCVCGVCFLIHEFVDPKNIK